jgi:hypothetical protein
MLVWVVDIDYGRQRICFVISVVVGQLELFDIKAKSFEYD